MIERYLDELFGRVRRLGPDGRRLLVEAEDHLRASAAAGEAAGLSRDEAERQAVLSFGPARQVASTLKRSRRRSTRQRVTVGAAAGVLVLVVAAGGWVEYQLHVGLPHKLASTRLPVLAVQLRPVTGRPTLAQAYLLDAQCTAGRTLAEIMANTSCQTRYGTVFASATAHAQTDLARCLNQHGLNVSLHGPVSLLTSDPATQRALVACQTTR